MRSSYGIAASIVAALALGLSAVFISDATRLGMSVGQCTFLRGCVSVILLLAIAARKRVVLIQPWNISKKIIAFCLTGSLAAAILLNVGYLYLPVGTVCTIHFLYPVIVNLAEAFVFHKRLAKRQAVFLCTAMLGVFLFCDSDQVNVTGVIIALLSAFAWSAHLIGLGHFSVRFQDPLCLSFYQSFLSVFVGIAMMLFEKRLLEWPALPKAYWMVILATVVGLFLGSILLQYSIRQIGAGLNSVFSVLEPIGTILFGALLLGDVLTGRQILSCIIIVVSILLLLLSNHLCSKKHSASQLRPPNKP